MWKWLVMVAAVLGILLAIDLSLRDARSPANPALAAEPVASPYPKAIAGSGSVEPSSGSVVIGPPEPGLVVRLHVAPGQAVAKGAPLLELDARDLIAQRGTAQAGLAVAEADLARAKAYRRATEEPGLRAKLAEAAAGVTEAEQSIAECQTQIANAQLQVAEAQDEVQEQAWDVAEKDRELKRAQGAAAGISQEAIDQARTALEVAQARQKSLEDRVEMVKPLVDAARARQAAAEARLASARAREAQAQAELDEFLAGPWDVDVARAQAAVDQARAQVEDLELRIERRTVRSPLDGTVLRCLIHEGDYLSPSTSPPEDSPLVLGAIDPLHVRVQVDEFDIPFFDPKARATAFLQTRAKTPIALEYVRTEPHVVPKRSLTNSQTEFVDTRVLHVVYRIGKTDLPLYVGQQMDVFIEEK